MLNEFVNIIKSGSVEVIDDSIFIKNHTVTDLSCLNALNSRQCINSFNRNGSIVVYDDLNINDTISIELSLLHLTAIGYYEKLETFIRKHKYSAPIKQYYIREINCFCSENNPNIIAYQSVVSLIDAIRQNARHCYSETDTEYSVIFREDKALFLPFIYDDADVQNIKTADVEKINSVSLIFKNSSSDKKKLLYINELIDFLSVENEDDRFRFLLSHITEFTDRADSAYQYYIRNFSYNQLKAELDNAALDYSKKIQSVINDAQTKLIAIPAAFLFAAATIDFDKILSLRNIGIIICSFIFAVLIDLFIKNQKSALSFIAHNIEQYRNSFSKQNKLVTASFSIVDTEIRKQKKRLNIIHWITWGLPIILFITTLIIFLCTIIQAQN